MPIPICEPYRWRIKSVFSTALPPENLEPSVCPTGPSTCTKPPDLPFLSVLTRKKPRYSIAGFRSLPTSLTRVGKFGRCNTHILRHLDFSPESLSVLMRKKMQAETDFRGAHPEQEPTAVLRNSSRSTTLPFISCGHWLRLGGYMIDLPSH